MDLPDRMVADEKMRQQVSSARELLSGSARAQMSMQGLIERPGGIVLKAVFAPAMADQDGDRRAAVTALEVLEEFISEVDVRREQLRRQPASAAAEARRGAC